MPPMGGESGNKRNAVDTIKHLCDFPLVAGTDLHSPLPGMAHATYSVQVRN